MSTIYGLHRSLLLNRNGLALSFGDRRRTWAEVGDRVAVQLLKQDRDLAN